MRQERNSLASDVVQSNEKVWRLVSGPPPEPLFAPSEEVLAAVQDTCERLEKLVEAKKDSHDGLGIFAEEILREGRTIQSLEWKTIRAERFHITPEGLFMELVKNVEVVIRRSAEEEERKQ